MLSICGMISTLTRFRVVTIVSNRNIRRWRNVSAPDAAVTQLVSATPLLASAALSAAYACI